MNYITKSDSESKELGKKIAKHIKGEEIICLYGELGAGKTTLVKGIAEGLGVTNEITSPTFTLMNVYPINNKQLTINNLIHIDTYRLKNEQELIDIGAADYVGQPETVTIIEWPEKISNLLKNKKVINIFIDHQNNNSRLITVNSPGDKVPALPVAYPHTAG